jgi:sensor histidine kinase YesM
LVAALVIGLIYAYIRAREKSLRRLSSLQRERLLFEYEHLKSQVNPHFLFNSLNTLANLIEEDRDAAVQYTNELSDLYRNMLTYRNKDLVPLAEEWNILQHYLYIQQSRFGDALQVELRVPETIMNTRRIVPLALQLLVENAIKHNVASRSRPLTIIIEAQGDRLAVRNAINPKLSKEKGAGLGLINIKKRYALITDRHISFGVVHNEYIVTLPLL